MKVYSIHYNQESFLKVDVAFSEFRSEDKIKYGKPLVCFSVNKCLKIASSDNIRKIIDET